MYNLFILARGKAPDTRNALQGPRVIITKRAGPDSLFLKVERDHPLDGGEDVRLKGLVFGVGQVVIAGRGVAEGDEEAVSEALVKTLGASVGAAADVFDAGQSPLQPGQRREQAVRHARVRAGLEL